MDLYHLRQGLHMIASSWDYHGGAESRVSVRENSVRFSKNPLLTLLSGGTAYRPYGPAWGLRHGRRAEGGRGS
jgi:hypothetical protein